MTETKVETLDALVSLARSVRPAWDTPGIRNAIRQALARDVQPTIAELAYALVRCAENPTIHTPAVVAMDGAHWGKAVREPGEPQRAVRCSECFGIHMPDAPHRTKRPADHVSIADRLEEARRVVHAARRPPDRTRRSETVDVELPDEPQHEETA